MQVSIEQALIDSFTERMTGEAREACETFKRVGVVVVDDYIAVEMKDCILDLMDNHGWRVGVDKTVGAGKVMLRVQEGSFTDPPPRWIDEQ